MEESLCDPAAKLGVNRGGWHPESMPSRPHSRPVQDPAWLLKVPKLRPWHSRAIKGATPREVAGGSVLACARWPENLVD